MVSKNRPEENEEVEAIELDEVTKICTSRIMAKLEPTIVSVEKLQKMVNEQSMDLTSIKTNIDQVKHELLSAIDALPKEPPLDPTQLQAIIAPMVKAEVQDTFKQVLLQFGVSKETVESGDMSRTISEILPKAMMMMAGNDALSKLKKPPGKTEEIGGDTAPAKPAPVPQKHTSLPPDEAYAFQHRCQGCGVKIENIGRENECPECGEINYAYRCGACREVILSILSSDMIPGSACPLCGTKFGKR